MNKPRPVNSEVLHTCQLSQQQSWSYANVSTWKLLMCCGCTRQQSTIDNYRCSSAHCT